MNSNTYVVTHHYQKIFKLTIHSNGSSSSTKVIKFPHINNNSILTHNDSQFKVSKSISTLTLIKINTMHELTIRFTHFFQSTFISFHSRSKSFFKDCSGVEFIAKII